MLGIFLRLLLCTGATYLLWRWLGPTGLVLGAPLFGVALARPVIDGMGRYHGFAKFMAFRKVNGRAFDFKGNAIDIEEDTDGYRWLQIADVRKVMPHLPGDKTLQAIYGEGVQTLDGSGVLRIQAETLLKHLDKASDPPSLRFKVWLQRAVVHPAAKSRPGGGR